MLVASSQRHACCIHDFAEYRLRLLRLFLSGDVARTYYHAVRKYWDHQPLEIVRQTVVAAFQECARLGCAMQHDRAARADSQAELFGLPRTLDDFQRVIQETFLNLYLRGGFLHGEHIGRVHQG